MLAQNPAGFLSAETQGLPFLRNPFLARLLPIRPSLFLAAAAHTLSCSLASLSHACFHKHPLLPRSAKKTQNPICYPEPHSGNPVSPAFPALTHTQLPWHLPEPQHLVHQSFPFGQCITNHSLLPFANPCDTHLYLHFFIYVLIFGRRHSRMPLLLAPTSPCSKLLQTTLRCHLPVR